MSSLSRSTEELLTSGGDERLLLDELSGLNRYGHGSRPLPGALAFGSSTASTISAGAFAAAESLHRQLKDELRTQNEGAVYGRGLAAVRESLRATLGLRDAELIIASSGTGIHLLLSQLLSGSSGEPLLAIAPQGTETGSGVGVALCGRHFVSKGCNGEVFTKGSQLPFASRSETAEFIVRDAQGELRPEDEIEAEIEAAIAAARRCGRRCLLVVADVSKTGLIAPGLSTVLRLKQRWPDVLDVLIDACQFRLEPQTIRAYLDLDFLVAVTGSKFVGGPIFSGALLCPPRLSQRLREKPLPECLGSYSVQPEWPADWQARRHLANVANWGLLLRWNAALAELAALHSIPRDQRMRTALAFSDAVQARLNEDPAFAAVAGRALDRSVLLRDPGGFDSIQTIFPFELLTPSRALTPAETAMVHQCLAAGSTGRPVHLGQPVTIGKNRAGLRICLSAPLLVKAAQGSQGMREVINQAMEALDHTGRMAQRVALDSSGIVSTGVAA